MSSWRDDERRPGPAEQEDIVRFLLPPMGHGQGESRAAFTIIPGHIPNPILWDTKKKAKERRDENKRLMAKGKLGQSGSNHTQAGPFLIIRFTLPD